MALKIFTVIEAIESELQNQNLLLDYRIVLKLSTDIEVNLLVEKLGFIKENLLTKFVVHENRIIINEIEKDELSENNYYKWLFSEENSSKVDYGLRLRLNNFIDFSQERKVKSDTPIVTFYSYKGGMGRSTTLALFASYLAKKEGRKVVVIDCDFEAPGFTNYYDLSQEVLSKKSGVAEYLLDKQFLGDSSINLNIEDDYSYNVGYEYVGNGQIHVIPAGNLWEDFEDKMNLKHSNRAQYLEAIARLDLSSVQAIIEQFEDFVNDINSQLQPDIILFDSRTGFNDVFATLASISNIVVGFFGINQQNIVGLEQFLKTFGSSESKKAFVVNSIISGLEYFETFKGIVNNYLDEETEQFEDRIIKAYSVQRQIALEKIGTSHAFRKEGSNHSFDVNFVDIVEKDTLFQPLFGDIFKSIEQVNLVQSNLSGVQKIFNKTEKASIEVKKSNLDSPPNSGTPLSFNEFIALRKSFIETLNLNIPNSHAEDIAPTVENFYYREYMKDLFNRDKFLIRGSKGTGKTFLYRAFTEGKIRRKIQQRANVNEGKFHFINLISLHNDVNGNRYLDTSKYNYKDSNIDYNFFFERFWLVYVWNSIMLKLKEENSGLFNSSLKVDVIENTSVQANKFKDIIEDDEKYNLIFNELKELDLMLQKKDENLIILFEQLDYIVRPIDWGKGISPLIQFWRSSPFKRILPKIFIRTDLLDKLTGTNSPNWDSRSIDIEWTKNEIFSYFFKIVLQHQEEDFYELLRYCSNYELSDLLQNIVSDIEDNEIPTKEKYLRPLVELFFGKYANWHNTNIDSGMGESYDWFERNLQDGNNRISLRPLIDMMRLATEKFIREKRYNEYENSILPASYYTDKDVRENCVKVHFEGLSKEVGNEPLDIFYKFITVDGKKEQKIPIFRRNEFTTMMNDIYTKYRGNDKMERISKPDDLKELLINNGIVKETDNTNRTYTNYLIPFLYRYYFRVNKSNMDKFKR